MSLVTTDQVRALVDTDLSDDDLQAVIDREEASLARVIGPLEGERTQTVYPDQHPETATLPVILQRPTDAVAVQDNGLALDATAYRLHPDGRTVERTATWAWWVGPAAFTYTPNDTLEVERVVIELTRLTVTETGYLSETIGEYTYSRGARGGSLNPTEAARKKLIQTLMPPLAAHTMRTATGRQWTPVWPQANRNNPYA